MRTLGWLVIALTALTVALLMGGCPGRSSETEVVTKPSGTSTPPQSPKQEGAGGIKVIGRGEEVKLEEHLVAGKTTLFDFYSEQCSACVMLAPELEKLAARRSDLAIVKVDVNRPSVTDEIDWDSPVARQHKLESLPHLVLFDPSGHKTAEGDAAYEQVAGWLER
jgi:thiol-disulfide isomerase/thioredoxin